MADVGSPLMSTWHSYPKIWALGHPKAEHVLDPPFIVEEKIDGSLFQCGRYEGVLRCASKGAEILLGAPEAMFRRAVEVAQTLPLVEGWCYRFEYLQKPKHNTLAYARVPEKHLILLDVETAFHTFQMYHEKQQSARDLGVECVPLIATYTNGQETIMKYTAAKADFHRWLQTPSVLGNCLLEGVVIKNYQRFDESGHVLMGKFVSEAFKESHKVEWRVSNPTKSDVVTQLIQAYHTPARWEKAVIHGREVGEVYESPTDIGYLLKAIQEDIKVEEIDRIKDLLFQWAWPQIRRGVTKGFPQWYKERLAERVWGSGGEGGGEGAG